MKSKTLVAGLIAAILGLASLGAENAFYGYIDADGVLRESAFLPIGMLLILVGAGLIVVGTVLIFLRRK